MSKIKAAVKLLKDNGYEIIAPPKESEYVKAIRTGIKPAIWPPLVMSRAAIPASSAAATRRTRPYAATAARNTTATSRTTTGLCPECAGGEK